MLFLTGIMGLLMAGASLALLPDDVSSDEDETPEGAEDEAGADLLEGGDTVTTMPGVETPERAASPEATEGNDILWGDAGDDVIDGQSGNDQINGYEGDDLIIGGEGDDRLTGGMGADQLEGGAGKDVLAGEDGDDRLDGGAGDDVLMGGFGDDRLAGAEGADRLIGGPGQDLLLGGAGDDALEGCDGDDVLIGGAGLDEMFGGAGNDLLDGRDAETDYLNGGTGQDRLLAGSGDWVSGNEEGDLFALGDWIDPENPAVLADFEPGLDRIALLRDPEDDEAALRIEPSQDTPGAVAIYLGARRLAEVLNAEGLSPEDILLLSPEEFANL
ncbi:calcium-binding protein [Sinirhodobacter sp. WL0062]|uniref:Calcium-binding protein n=1 Tax=Rhodobacter flavimaris TaxID=2907145 RepID=A0ABS8YTX0_9RHOB|nr:calcium-binding protein [Sinirhodobacter sp. WL0062]MCE5973306.1 calcium-binding protein [Sinirhodobacter sp. WL0062]